MDIIRAVEAKQMKENAENFNIGDTVRVSFKIVEGTTERVQVFEGIVIAKNNTGIRRTFVVRKISYGVGVERIFPMHSPRIEKICCKKRSRKKSKALLPPLESWKERKGSRASYKEECLTEKRQDYLPFNFAFCCGNIAA